MESFVRSPSPLKDDKPKTWSLWKEEFLIFMSLLEYTQRSQSFRANLLKNLIGPVGLEIINSKLSFDNPSEKENIDILLKKLNNYYYPEETEIQKRFKFFNSHMKTDETIENYIQDLRVKGKECDFGNLTDSLVRDVIILNTSDKILRQKYMQEENLTCNKIIEIYKNHKMYCEENKVKSKQETKNVGTSKKVSSNVTFTRNCWRCQTKHALRQCPAWNYKCSKCNIMHHFEKCCKDMVSQPQSTSGGTNMNNLNTNEKRIPEDKLPYNILTNMY